MSCSNIIFDILCSFFVKSLHFFSLVIIRSKNGDEVGVITQFLAEMITPPWTCLTNTFSKERTVVDPRWRTTTITRTNTMKIHLVFRRYCWWDQKRVFKWQSWYNPCLGFQNREDKDHCYWIYFPPLSCSLADPRTQLCQIGSWMGGKEGRLCYILCVTGLCYVLWPVWRFLSDRRC